jgi:hypothetical protein
MYRTVVTIYTASGQYVYRTVVTIYTASGQYMYRTVVTIYTASGHYTYRTVLTTCTAQWSLYVPPGLTLKNSTFCPHSVFMCFVWIPTHTAIISLYNINWLVTVTGTGSVYFAVRAQYYNEIHVFSLSRAHVKSVVNKVSLVRICLRVLRLSLVHSNPPTFHTHLHRHVATTERMGRRRVGTSHKHRLVLKQSTR